MSAPPHPATPAGSTSTARPASERPIPAAPVRAGRSPAGGRVRRRRRDRAGYLFLLPWFIGMLFMVIPFFASLYLAFTDYNLLNAPQWIGLDNFREMLGDAKLHQALK